MNEVEIRIGRVVWQGAACPEAAELAERIGAALTHPLIAPRTPIDLCAAAIAREIAPRLAQAREPGRG